MQPTDGDRFEAFAENAEPRLRRAFVAAYGPDRGAEATCEALAYAWEHWDDVELLDNPAGYLYRVGQSRTRPRRFRTVFPPAPRDLPHVEPGLPAALEALTEAQRSAVVLAHGYGWTLAEVAELTGVTVSTVQTHLDRGLAKLRSALEVLEDV